MKSKMWFSLLTVLILLIGVCSTSKTADDVSLNERGWKDTVSIEPDETVKLAGRFKIRVSICSIVIY